MLHLKKYRALLSFWEYCQPSPVMSINILPGPIIILLHAINNHGILAADKHSELTGETSGQFLYKSHRATSFISVSAEISRHFERGPCGTERPFRIRYIVIDKETLIGYVR